MDIQYLKSILFSILYLRLWGVKTYAYFGKVIDRLVKSLFNGNVDLLEFVQIFEDLLYGQLRDAWLEGMAQNGLTEDDMTPEYETELGGIIQRENGEVLDFADAIVQSRPDGLDAMLSRADLWQSRYYDVVNQAALYTADRDAHYVWRLGNTEKHCETCAALDGTVATAAQWEESGLHPQQPANDRLECGGWKCDCHFELTEEPLTEGGIPNV